jgi:hypothetical protein
MIPSGDSSGAFSRASNALDRMDPTNYVASVFTNSMRPLMSGEHDQVGNPRKWRLRAEQTRVAAEDMQNPINRAAALRLADDYERIARKAEDEERRSNPDQVAGGSPNSGDQNPAHGAPEHCGNQGSKDPRIKPIYTPAMISTGPMAVEDSAD